jgi:nitroimidazol reductase NimA-like FMN-containing flavoprotein (pyridoxamine 5'-phosphate oxidase superfamily)
MVNSALEELSYEECVGLLRMSDVGRVAVLVGDAPAVMPVNFRLVEDAQRTWIAFRTRRGNDVERAPIHVAFEIDSIDPVGHEGWSVLVRGTLHHVDPDAAAFRERFDPEPWLLADRDAWLVIEPHTITGRRLHAAPATWSFNQGSYL